MPGSGQKPSKLCFLCQTKNPPLGPVRMFSAQVQHKFVAIEGRGAHVEWAQTAFASTVGACNDGELWAALHQRAIKCE